VGDDDSKEEKSRTEVGSCMKGLRMRKQTEEVLLSRVPRKGVVGWSTIH